MTTPLLSALYCSIFSKLRLDTNCTLDSVDRSYRGRKPISTECKTCKTKHTVKHILFECKMTDLLTVRNIFERKICDIIKEYKNLESCEKLKQVLSLEPDCPARDRPEVEGYICAFVKNVYAIVNRLSITRC